MVGITKFEKLFPNSHHETDFEFATRLNRRLLKIIGMWPSNSKNSEFISKLANIACLFFLLFLTVPGFIELTLTRDLKSGLEKVGPFSFTMANLLFYYFLLFHRKEINICIETMCDDWRSVNNQYNREIMLKNVYTARTFIIVCSSFMYAGSLSFTFFFPLLDNFISSGNQTDLKIAFSGNYILFDPQVRPYFDVIFILQLFGSFTCCSLTSGICSMTISFVMHISGQLQIVTGFLNLLVTENKFQSTDKLISHIVQRHLRSLRKVYRIILVTNLFVTKSFAFILISIVYERKN